MRRGIFILLVWALVITGCGQKPRSGIDLENFDKSVRPQDNFYLYVNGTWLKTAKIPADKSNYGSFTKLVDESEKNLRMIIEEAGNAPDKKEGSDVQKIGDLYASFMDTATVEELGLKPVRDELDRITALKTRSDVARHMGYLQTVGVQRPLFFFIDQDEKNSTRYLGYFHQSGLGLPDRDYYLKDGEKFVDLRQKYKIYVARLLELAGVEGGEKKAERQLAIETELARHHWERADNRDREKTYNIYSTKKMQTLMPDFDWAVYLNAAGLSGQDEFVIRQPSYAGAFNSVFRKTGVEDWKTYMTVKLLDGVAPLLDQEFVNAHFEFNRKALRGIEENRPRWKRGVGVVEEALGEVLGKVYVERHFKEEAKQRMEKLVENLRLAFADRIKGLDWMGEDTKKQALDKLAKFRPKIGYPNKWKDYSALEISKDDLVGNMKRSALVEYNREIGKLGQPIDREEWFMTPQRVNAYYNPQMNEIVFPAAILQPPFFNFEADDAVNYGAIGAVIGHEMGHGFDDQGRKSDGDGNLRDWWTEEDAKAFEAKANILVDQYNEYSPLDTMHVNGRLTLGENIGDLGGMAVAFEAYQMSLNGKEAAEIDELTGNQRFFMGWAQVWRRLYRDEELRQRLLTDPHSPSQYRCNGVLANMPAFYEAFGVKKGDMMFRPENLRVSIW